jgi:ribosomal protein L14E/L6E/L27E
MAAIEKGRNVLITRGADAGKKAVVEEMVNVFTIRIKVENGKSRNINIRHVEPLAKRE